MATSLSFLISFSFFISCSSVNKQTTIALDKIYEHGRPFESRISDLKYAPFVVTRGESDRNNADPVALRSVELDLITDVINNRNAENLHALGKLYLASRDFDKAIGQLENAKKMAADDVRILNDLGTAYLEKSHALGSGEDGKQLKMRAMALEEFEKALEIKPGLPETVFNRSICRQLLVLPFQARQSWQEYLELDPVSPWAEEARRNLDKLGTGTAQNKTSDELLQDFMAAYRARDDEKAYQIVSRNREMITGKLIPQRLAKLITETEGDEKSEYMAALEYIGKQEKERSGDPFFLELAKYYSAASKEKFAALREAHASVFLGYDLSTKNNYKDSLTEFRNAEETFSGKGDTWNAGICSYWIGYLLSNQSQIEEGSAILENALKQNKRNKWLSSQYLNWLGYNLATSRQFSKSLEYNQRAFELAAETNDLYLTQKTLSQRTMIYRRLGQYRRALDSLCQVFQINKTADASERQIWRDLDSAAGLFFEMKFLKASESFETEALNLAAKRLDEKTFDFESNLKLGMIYDAQGRYQDALSSFEAARRIAEAFPNEKSRTRSLALVSLRMAHPVRKNGNCADALTGYNEALRFYDTGEYHLNQYEAHKGRLLCYARNNDDEAVKAELPVVLALIRDYRAKIREEHNRNSFFDTEQESYDIIINYEFSKLNYEAAFDYSEESRSRSLLDMQVSPVEIAREGTLPEIKFSTAVTEPLKLAQMLPEIPAGVQVVQYTVLEDKILIWLITREGFSVTHHAIAEAGLRERVSNYMDLVTQHDPSGADRTAAAAKELYGILINPVKDRLDPNKEICIIPDKALFRLSFSSLISPGTGKYFLTEFAMISAPSLNIFLNSSGKAAEQAEVNEETLLSIGNPSFSEKDFPGLGAIDSAANEAKKIGMLYGHAKVITGTDALKEKVISSMPSANVIHFGGHYIVNEGSPLLSGFVLSENTLTLRREDSLLANYEVFGDKLSNARLIVLAACETGLEGYYGGEGMVGASRTFLAAGVPLVVASQWAVDSESTAELMVRFHKYRKTEQLSTSQALRRAQLGMLEGNVESYRDPYYWAGFVTFGGYAQF